MEYFFYSKFSLTTDLLYTLANPGKLDYFDELLERIRTIRASEKRFYQKIKDIYMLSADYDPNYPMTQEFFATVQNKLLFATTGMTAAEIIHSKVDIRDVVLGHELALNSQIKGYEVFNISAQTPFQSYDLKNLHGKADEVILKYYPWAKKEFNEKKWSFPSVMEFSFCNR